MATITITNRYYDFPDIFLGDTFVAQSVQCTDENDLPPTNNLARVWMQIRLRSKTGTVIKEIDSDVSGVTIDDAVNWLFTIEKFDIEHGTFSPGNYFYDIQTFDVAGIKETIFEGIILVKQDTTYTP
jgi:hypothetical protein